MYQQLRLSEEHRLGRTSANLREDHLPSCVEDKLRGIKKDLPNNY